MQPHWKTFFCGILAISFTTTLSTRGASVWIGSGAQIDEVVANDKTVPPASPVEPLLASVPFSNFRYPHVDLKENVTFIADDPVYQGKALHHGIYRSLAATGELRALVRQDETAVPSANLRFDWFRGLQVDGPDFVFNAVDRAGQRGLYYWSNDSLRMIARSDTTSVPGVGDLLTGVEYGALSSGRILYNALTDGENLLVLHELASGKSRVLCRSGMEIPQRSGDTFKYFSPQNWLDPKNIVFRAADVKDPHKNPSDTAGHRGIYAWLDIDWKAGDEALAPSRLTTLADRSTIVPLIPKARFTDFRSAPVRNGLVVFNGGGPNFSGIYYCRLEEKGHAVRPVVDSESALRGLFAGSFESFGIFCTIFEKDVVFVGYAAGGYVGVFLYRTDTEELFVLCDNRSPIENKQVKDFEIAGDFMVRNRFAVAAHFKDKSSGIYLATIPSWSFKRMASGAQQP